MLKAGIENHIQNTLHETLFAASSEKEIPKFLPLPTSPYNAAAIAKFG